MRQLPKLSQKAWTGIGLIYLAGICWTAELFIPFSNMPHKGTIFIVVLIAAELLFLGGVALLGKAYYKELKAKLIKFLRTGPTKPKDN